MQLEEAEAAGQARILHPGESMETDAAFVLYSGRGSVTEVRREADGFVVR
jgi:hypothetical protein